MNKLIAWLIGGLAGLATLFLLPFLFIGIVAGISLVLPVSVGVQETIIVAGMLISLLSGIAVSIWLTSRLQRKRPASVEPVRSDVRFTCPSCGAVNTVAENLAGQQVACGNCRQAVLVPIVASVAAPPTPSGNKRWLGILCILLLIVVSLGATWFSSLRRMLAERENNTQTTVNMKLLVQALHAYHKEHGQFPPAMVRGQAGEPLYSWRVLILPHLGEHELAQRFRYDEPWDSPHNKVLLDQMPRFFRSGFEWTTTRSSTSSYLLLGGPGTVFAEDGSPLSDDIIDGAANTVCLVEVLGSGVHWTEPVDLDLLKLCQTGAPQGDFPVVLNSFERITRVAMFDGSVVVPDKSLSLEDWVAACLPSDGQ